MTDVREVEIGAWRYRVRRLSDDEVEVVGGDAAAPRTGNVLQRFQLAAERATGCKMRKPGWGDVGVRGTLDCTARRIP